MHELVIRLKSGREFTVICEECSLTRNGFGVVTNIRFEGVQNIRPLILDPSQIELMYEVLQPEADKACDRYAVVNDKGDKEYNCIGCGQTDCPWK